MKKLYLITLLLLVNLLVFSQYHEVLFDDSGNPTVVRFFENGTVNNYFLNEVSEDGFYTIDTDEGKLIIDARLNVESTQGINDPLDRSDMITNFDPSPAPNGDFVQKISYTPDGELIAVLHKHSDNLFLYNSSSFEVEHIIDLGRGPMDMKVTDDFIYVCCYYSKEIQIVDLETYSVTSNIILPKNPCQIELNPEKTIAFVGFIDDNKGAIAAYNLETGTQIFETSDPKIYIMGGYGTSGRVGYTFMPFYLSPDGNKMIARNHNDRLGIYNAINGELMQTFSLGIYTGAGFSKSGDTLFCSFVEYPDNLNTVYRINMENMSVIDSIVASSIAYGEFADLSVNFDGSKVLSKGDLFANGYMFFDFDTYQYNIIASTGFKSSNLNLKIENLDYAIMFNFGFFDIVDLNSGQLVATSYNNIEVGWAGAISPSGTDIFVSDGVCEHRTFDYLGEVLHAIDISDPSNYNVDTSFYAGSSFEADQTNMAWLIDDGKKIIASNKLTQNISIIDIETGFTDTLIYYKNISGLKIIPDKNQAIIYSDFSDTIRIFNLETHKYITSINVGEVNELVISSDGQWAYILDYNAIGGLEGLLTKVKLDGSASIIEQQMTINAQSGYYWNFRTGVLIWSKIKITPNGKYCFYLEKNEIDEYFIGIVDVVEMEIVALLPTNDYNIFDYVFSDDSRWALPLCYSDSLPIVYIDGEDSFVSNTFPVDNYCFSAAYNPVDSMFYVLEIENKYHSVDPEIGEIVETFDTDINYQYNIKIDNTGDPAVLSATNITYKDKTYSMIGKSAVMNYYKDHDIFVIPIPGPDKIVTLGDLSVDFPESPPYVIHESFNIIPNPAKERILIKSDLIIDRIEIMDITGKVHIQKNVNRYNPTVNISMLKSGIYFVQMVSGTHISNNKMYVY